MRGTRLQQSIGLGMAVLACGLTACDRGQAPGQGAPTPQNRDQVEPLEQKPDYAFAAGLEDEYPEVVGFLRHFMETCLAGDYAGYRRLVSRAATPESRARFEKVLNSLRSLTIESIQEIDLARVPPPAYLVISQVDLLPNRKVALRRGNKSRVAILVFEEENELRMVLAPSELQPEVDEDQTSTAPATSAPSYPWQEDVDY